MKQKKKSFAQWFGEQKHVRIMLLGALLILGILHIEFIVQSILNVWQIAKPLLVGLALAYVLEIIVKRLEKIMFPNTKIKWLDRSRRGICIGTSLILVLSLLTLIIAIVIPGLVEGVNLLTRALPQTITNIRTWVLDTFAEVPTVTNFVEENINFNDWDSIQTSIINWAVNGINGNTLLSGSLSVLGWVFGSIANFLISLVFALFLLVAKKELQNQFQRLLKALLNDKPLMRTQMILGTTNRCFSGFIVGQTINALILGVLTWLGMKLFGMPYALIVGVLSGTTALVPIIGGYIGAAAGTFLVFTSNPGQALWFLLFIVALQTIQGNLIYPRLLGSSVGLPGLWVLVSVTIGGGLGGVLGMLVAVPIAATIYALISNWVHEKEVQDRVQTESMDDENFTTD